MDSEIAFPAEIICHILSFLDPIDIVRLRLVSKQFREITYDVAIWKTLYSNARVPRPPGPFPRQSVSFFERTLVQSSRFVESWMREPLHDIASTHIQVGGLPTGPPKLIGGRWLLGCKSSKQFVLHDVDSKTSPPMVLWEFEGSISSWDACYISSPTGEFIYVVFCEKNSEQLHTPWKLVEFQFDSDSGDVRGSMSMNVPTSYFKEFVHLSCYHGPLLYTHYQQLIFDTQTHIFYKFPNFASAVNGLPLRMNEGLDVPTPHQVLFSHNYIIASWAVHIPSSRRNGTLFQAFTMPANPGTPTKGPHSLRLTHEVLIHEEISRFIELRQSTTDPITGATSIRFLRLHRDMQNRHSTFKCLDLTLPPLTSQSDLAQGILPISIRSHDIFNIEHGFDGRIDNIYIESSDDGHTRGFCQGLAYVPRLELVFMKFTIDATQKTCTGVCSEWSLPQWKRMKNIPHMNVWFDGVRGRLCYGIHGLCRYPDGGVRGAPHVDVTVVDIR